MAQSVVAYQHFMREHMPGSGSTRARTSRARSSWAAVTHPSASRAGIPDDGLGLRRAQRRSPTSSATRSTCCGCRRLGRPRGAPSGIPGAIVGGAQDRAPDTDVNWHSHSKTELGGVRIAAGENVLVVFGSANHDEHHFRSQALTYIATASTHMGFGWGTHFCARRPLARLEAASCWRHSQRWPNLRLAPGQHSVAPQRSHVPWCGEA